MKPFAIAALAILAVLAIAGYWVWSRTGKPAPVVVEQPVTPAPSKPAEPTAETRPEPAPAAAAPAPSPSGSDAASTRTAILAATFFTDERTEKSLQELRDAGLKAFSVEVALRDGRTGKAIYVGPYTDRATAEADLARARALPGYEEARIVPMKKPATSP
jgi:cell division septation protein DedD